jgi:hypothetical protein
MRIAAIIQWEIADRFVLLALLIFAIVLFSFTFL